MSSFGTLHKQQERYVLRFERHFSKKPEHVFSMITNPDCFIQWYPFATGELELRVGGKIGFDDGEGATYEGVITKLTSPYAFEFQEVNDWINISLAQEDSGCMMVFTHLFEDVQMAKYTAAGWHRCLDVFEQIVYEQQVEWKDHAEQLRKYYEKAFHWAL
ncbi:SRPBCC domain-containing protein [Alkalihalobacillus pseudalcaliphilus]|uniref:SRPBCC domain-containing protein n=1 Tax=Alkalihalobacillus pseudalcaliphilus TaxID=79884 RepID=UPI00064DC0B8|nr:SRPBCC domain-containing protein [Alkalihalobacillus pseudalcaliphilus]KMK77979.1 hypothetical protein AB990_00545 [Alkalihalobacillus pseudalcaliphilus]